MNNTHKRIETMNKTVLITGLSGFIAKHIALQLLVNQYRVRGTVRDITKGEKVKETLAQAGGDISKLELVQADLEKDDGWPAAVSGVDYVIHVASPFPLEQPEGRLDLVSPAREGTLRVLNAVRNHGTTVDRVVLTSSMVAMMYRANRPRDFVVQEDDWTDTEWEQATPYIISKTLAEKAAWQWAIENDTEKQLVVINPGFVLGPALDTKASTSIEVIKLLLNGAYPAVPPVYFPVVDVRDLADLHTAALTAEGVGGRRLIGSGDTLSMADMGTMLKQAFPERAKKAPTRTLPALLVRFLALFDRSMRTILADMNVVPQAENEYVTELTGIRFRPSREAVIATGQSLLELGIHQNASQEFRSDDQSISQVGVPPTTRVVPTETSN
jgi:dihydroflavonol-4-reductase